MKRLIAVAAALSLAGCLGPSEDEKTKELVQAAVRNALKDPGSAQFGDFRAVGSEHACQTVNARNGFGGYGGDKQAFVMKVKGDWYAMKLEPVSHGDCIQIMKEIIDENARGKK